MQMIEIAKLIPHPRNQEFFDDITGDKWEDFKKSIIRRGVVESIVVTQDLVIVSGHQRVRACKELGILEVPCRVTHYPDEDERLHINKEDMILEDLISTNVFQRGIGNINAIKMMRCVMELERIYGIRQGSAGGNGSNQYINKELEVNNSLPAKTESDLADQLGMDVSQLKNYKKLNNLIPELQDLVESNSLKATTAYKIWAKMPKEEQEKFFNEIGKEKIQQMTQKQTEEYLKEKEGLIQQNEDLKEKINKQQELQTEIDDLKTKLQEKPKEIVKEVPVIPNDYDNLKKQLHDSNNYYDRLKIEYDKKVKEYLELENQIKAMNDNSTEKKYQDKLKDDAILFCAKVDNFISQVGGLAYLGDHITELPANEKKAYVKCVDLVMAWAENIKINMKEFI